MRSLNSGKAFFIGSLLCVTSATAMNTQPASAGERRELNISAACAKMFEEGPRPGKSNVYFMGGWHTPIVNRGQVIQHVCGYKFLSRKVQNFQVQANANANAKAAISAQMSKLLKGSLIIDVVGQVGGEYGEQWDGASVIEAKVEPVWNQACKSLYGNGWIATFEPNRNNYRNKIFCVR